MVFCTVIDKCALNTIVDVPGIPGRPVAARTWDTCVYLVWSEPIHDGNNSIQRFKVDCKPQGSQSYTCSTCFTLNIVLAIEKPDALILLALYFHAIRR